MNLTYGLSRYCWESLYRSQVRFSCDTQNIVQNEAIRKSKMANFAIIEAESLTIKMEVSLGTRGNFSKVARYERVVVVPAWLLRSRAFSKPLTQSVSHFFSTRHTKKIGIHQKTSLLHTAVCANRRTRIQADMRRNT